MARRISWGCERGGIDKHLLGDLTALALTSALERLLDGHLGEGVGAGIDMIIDKKLLDELTASAQASARLRMNYDLRNSALDGSQRMLNALEPGTVMPIHRHHASSETVVILRGRIRWIF